MSQPPGPPSGGQYGYGPPGFPPGGPGGYGPYGQPPKKSALPWIITAVVVVLAGVGVLLFFLLRGDGDGSDQADRTSSTTTSSSPKTSEPVMSMDADMSIPPGADTPPPTNPSGSMDDGAATADGGQFAGSDQVALAWVQSMYTGDFTTAYQGLCPDYQQGVTDLATQNGVTPEEALSTIFYGGTLEGRGIDDGTLDSVSYDSEQGLDVASFALQLDDGSEFTLLVGVDSSLAVCGWA
jgi:hypothetical protein